MLARNFVQQLVIEKTIASMKRGDSLKEWRNKANATAID